MGGKNRKIAQNGNKGSQMCDCGGDQNMCMLC